MPSDAAMNIFVIAIACSALGTLGAFALMVFENVRRRLFCNRGNHRWKPREQGYRVCSYCYRMEEVANPGIAI